MKYTLIIAGIILIIVSGYGIHKDRWKLHGHKYVSHCWDVVHEVAASPSSVVFIRFRHTANTNPETVLIEFEESNQFGAMVKSSVSCSYNPNNSKYVLGFHQASEILVNWTKMPTIRRETMNLKIGIDNL